MVFISGLKDNIELAMYEGKNGKVISSGKTESYIRFHFDNKTLIEFIPNIHLKPFGWLSV